MSRQHRRRVRRHLAIDDGTDDSILALQVAPDRMVAQGSRVRARVSPLLGYVAAIEVLEHPVGDDRPVLHEMVEGLAVRGTGAMAGGLTAAAAATRDAPGSSGPHATADVGLDQLGKMLDGLAGLRGGPRRSDGAPLIADVSRRLQAAFDAADQPRHVEDDVDAFAEGDGPSSG